MTTGRRVVNDRSLVLLVVGAACVVAAFKLLPWYSTAGGNNVAGTGFTFDDLGGNADALNAAVAGAYFSWLAWTLLIATGVLVVAASVPSPATDALRVLAFVGGLVGLVATYYALLQLFDAEQAAGGSSHSVFSSSSYGLWAALVGFVLLTVAGTWGARRAG